MVDEEKIYYNLYVKTDHLVSLTSKIFDTSFQKIVKYVFGDCVCVTSFAG